MVVPTTARRRSRSARAAGARRAVQGRRVRVADAPDLPDGPGEHVPRPVDDHLAQLLAADGSAGRAVLVVTGPASSGVTVTAARAVRRARPGDLFVPVPDPQHTALAELVERARRRASPARPVLVWCDDAPLALLDQVHADVLAACSVKGTLLVRLVLTVRPGLPALSAGELAAPRFAPVVVPVLPGAQAEDGDAARAALAGEGGDLLRLAVAWHRLGVPTALDHDVVAALCPDLAGTVTALVEQGWLARGERGLVPARALVGPAGPPPGDLVARIAGRLDHPARLLATRTTLAAGLDGPAALLAADLEPDPLGPAGALRIARGHAGLARDRDAAQWFAFVVATGDEEQVRAAHRGLGLIFYRYDRLDRARTHLDRAADQLGVQVVLADIALRQGRVDDARTLLATLRRSHDAALAAEAACQLGSLETSAGDEEAARVAFTAALDAADPAVVERARAGLTGLPDEG